MVQVAGSREWRPLKEVIAEVRVAEKYAAKKQQEAAKEKRPPKKRGGRDALPLIPPPPRREPEARPPETPASGEPPSDAGADEPLGVLPEGFAPRSPPARTRTPEPALAPPPSPSSQEPLGAEEFPNAFIDDPHPQGGQEKPTPADEGAAPAPMGAADEPPVIPPGDESIRISVPDEPVGLVTGEEPPGILPEGEPPSIAPPGAVDPGEEPLAVLPDAASPVAPSPEEPVGIADDEPLGILPEDPVPGASDVGPGEGPSPPPETEGFGSAFIDPAASSGIEDLVEVPDEPPVIAPEVEPPVIFPSESPAQEAVSHAPSAPAPPDEPPVAPTPPPAGSAGDDRPGTTPPSRVRVVVRDPMARSVEARPLEPPAAPPDTSPGEPAPQFPSAEDESPGPPFSAEPPPPEPPPVLEEDVSSLPVIPLKPGDSLPPAAATEAPPPAPRTRPPARRPVPEEDPVFAAPTKRGPLVEALLAAAAAAGALLSRALSPINRLERGEPVTSEEKPAAVGPALQDLRTKASTLAGTVGQGVGELAGRARDSLARKDSSTEETSTQPPLPLVPPPPRPRTTGDGTPSGLAVTLQKLTSTVSSWLGALREWAGRLVSALPFPSKKEDSGLPSIGAPELPEEPTPLSVEPLASSIEPDAPETSRSDDIVPVSLKKPTWRIESPAPVPTPPPPEVPEPPVRVRQPREEAPRVSTPAPSPKPPPSMTELPSIPLAPQRHQPREEVGDVYEGPGMADVLHVAWAWTKVLLVLAAAGAIVTFAALNWRTWFPRATELGRQAFIEVDKVARSGEFRKAVDDAAAQLPQLSPETIRQVQDRSPSGLLEPVEVFRVASEAAQRGQSTFTAEESAELQALRREMLSGLSSADRERLREYEDIRARREPFPVENASALAVYARAARGLPPESLERLQALLAKAVAAGLETPTAGE